MMRNTMIVTITLILLILSVLPRIGHASRLNQEDGILPNHSAEYVRTLNRNASMDADAAFYNPAGLSFMEEDGFYLMLSAQTCYVKKEHTMDYYAIKYDTKEYVQTYHTRSAFEHTNMPDPYYAETTAPILPDFDLIYKKDHWAAYFDFSVMQAAPDMYFPFGLAVMDWGNLASQETTLADVETSEFNAFMRTAEATRNEMYLGATFGGSYAVNESWSFAAGLRYIRAEGNMKIKVTDIGYTIDGVTDFNPEQEEWDIDTDTEGNGFGIILGADYRFSDRLNFGFRYEYYTPLELEKTTNKLKAPMVVEESGNLDIFKDGTPGKDMEYKSDGGNGSSVLKVTYPQTFSVGMSHYMLDNLRFETSGEVSLRNQRDLDGREDDWDVGYKLGGCLEWIINPNVKASVGYLYNDFGIKDDKRDEADLLLTSHTIGGGFGLTLSDQAELSLGMLYMFHVDESTDLVEYTDVTAPTWHAVKKGFDEERFIVSMGLTYRFNINR